MILGDDVIGRVPELVWRNSEQVRRPGLVYNRSHIDTAKKEECSPSDCDYPDCVAW
jgi:hypothetical protein